jgi:hypothetical protein
MSEPAKTRDRLVVLPGSIRHVQSRDGLKGEWRKISRVIYSPRILGGLPVYTRRLARVFIDTDPSDVVSAIHGDPAFFVAFQMRLDQIDCAMVAAGRTLAERAPLVRSKWILDGFRDAAIEALVRKGGVWPPSAGDAPA